MKTNTARKPAPVTAVRTHGGAPASNINYEQQLMRSVMACMLWEDTFYEDGELIANRIKRLVGLCRPAFVAATAVHAREEMNLRHVPLLLVREMARLSTHKMLVEATLLAIIQRPDEIAEFLSIYFADGKTQPIAAQVKRGLAKALLKFDEYQLAKYRGEGKEYTLRDVMFLTHAKPATGKEGRTSEWRKSTKTWKKRLNANEKLFQKLADNELATPDTWEVNLSGGADKKETFERLMKDKKLGALAFLRNLRGMSQAGVDRSLMAEYSNTVRVERVLPFRFLAAARAVPMMEDILEPMMFRCLEGMPKLKGKTVFVVDTSGSMWSGMISGKSDLSRIDAAAALTALIREVAEQPVIYATAGNDGMRVHATGQIRPRRGFALIEAITGRQAEIGKLGGGGIFLQQCLEHIKKEQHDAERVIVLTDEQDCSGYDAKLAPDRAPAFGKHNYIINVSVNQNGIAYKKFTHINGWSEAVIKYIVEYEREGELAAEVDDQLKFIKAPVVKRVAKKPVAKKAVRRAPAMAYKK